MIKIAFIKRQLKGVYHKFAYLSNNYQNKKVNIISMHIPKTGGMSFHAHLKHQYGKNYYYAYQGSMIETRFNAHQGAHIYPGKKVIHGHFSGFKRMKAYYPNAKLITWLRHPVKRLISHYNFFQKIELPHNRSWRTMKQENLSLLEFARHADCRESVFVYESYLGNLDFEDFYFVGLTEHYSDHIQKLARMMNWRQTREIKENTTGRSSKKMEDLELIETILEPEIEIYNYYKERILNSSRT